MPSIKKGYVSMLNKKSIRILKYIYKHPYVRCLDLLCFKHRGIDREFADKIIPQLIDQKFISCRSVACEIDDSPDKVQNYNGLDGYFVTLPAGDIIVETELRETRRWIVGTLIAAASVIVGFLSLR
jgi:hypothetical protein|nr:MAG TPA: MarR family [Caudoviricetes sp.]